MGEIFQGIMGDFEGYALENLQEGNPNPELDTTNFEDFFGSDKDFAPEEEEEKPKKKKSKKKKRKRIFNKSKPVFSKQVFEESKGAFSGF